MENEKFQQMVVNQLVTLTDLVKGLEIVIKGLDAKLDNLEHRLDRLELEVETKMLTR